VIIVAVAGAVDGVAGGIVATPAQPESASSAAAGKHQRHLTRALRASRQRMPVT